MALVGNKRVVQSPVITEVRPDMIKDGGQQ